MRASAWTKVSLAVICSLCSKYSVAGHEDVTVCVLDSESNKCGFYTQGSDWSVCVDGLRTRNVTAGTCEDTNDDSCAICEADSSAPAFGSCLFDYSQILHDGNKSYVEEWQNCTIPEPPSPSPIPAPPVLPPPPPSSPPVIKPWKLCDSIDQYIQVELETFGSTLQTLNTHGDFFLQSMENETNAKACFLGSPADRGPYNSVVLNFKVLWYNITEEHATALVHALKIPDYFESMMALLQTRMMDLYLILVIDQEYVTPAIDSESGADVPDPLPEFDADIASSRSRVGAMLVVLLPIAAATIVLAGASVYVYRIRRANSRLEDRHDGLDPANMDGPQPMIFTSYSDNPVHHHAKRRSSDASEGHTSIFEKLKRTFHRRSTVAPDQWHQDCVDDVCMRFNVGLQSVNESAANMFPSISDDVKSALLPRIKELCVSVGDVVSLLHGHVAMVVPGQTRLPRHKVRKLVQQHRNQAQACRALLHRIEDVAMEQGVGLVHHVELVQGIAVVRDALDACDRLLQHVPKA